MSTNDTDDGWDDLARELGIAPAPQELPEPLAQSEATEGEEGAAGDDDDSAVAMGDEGATGEGEGDEPRKKRRRRRRRRKGPGEGETEGSADSEAETEAESDEDGEEPDVEAAEVIDTGEPETASVAATRALIDTWDVPSWETIVTTMLLRPQR